MDLVKLTTNKVMSLEVADREVLLVLIKSYGALSMLVIVLDILQVKLQVIYDKYLEGVNIYTGDQLIDKLFQKRFGTYSDCLILASSIRALELNVSTIVKAVLSIAPDNYFPTIMSRFNTQFRLEDQDYLVINSFVTKYGVKRIFIALYSFVRSSLYNDEFLEAYRRIAVDIQDIPELKGEKKNAK